MAKAHLNVVLVDGTDSCALIVPDCPEALHKSFPVLACLSL